MAGTLYVVATPIGNLSDLSERAWRTLKEVDFIAAEDTRVSRKLLAVGDFSKPVVSYHEHNKASVGPGIVERLLKGESCALVSDAGTPAISDPGEDLCDLCIRAGVPVTPIPGPCAAVAALSASGMRSGRFVFEGFLPVQKKSRRERLAELQTERRTVILYEAPHKLRATLKDLLNTLGDRPLCLAREVTKLHEQFLRMTLAEASAYYEENEPRGEYVLILEGASGAEEEKTPPPGDPVCRVRALMAEGARRSDAVKQAAREFSMTKSELYRLALPVGQEDGLPKEEP